MHLSRLILTACLCLLPSLIFCADDEKIKQYAEAIDKILYKGVNEDSIQSASDEVFLRRASLNIIGRIPTNDEYISYMGNHPATRRQKLIKKLMSMDEYREGIYPMYANMLRLQSRINGVYGDKYALWVKQAVTDNMPYDEFVYKLLSAKGTIAQNSAVGYYFRDNGNILETASTTAQVFLGTQIGCAQCHDHAFEDWTQKQFYEFASFMGKVNTNDGSKVNEIKKNIKEDFLTQREKQILNQIMTYLPFEVKDVPNKELRLPGDYKYKNAKPNEVIKPQVFYGEQPKIADQKERRVDFAKWVTSRDNPYFTKVIVNRLWKKVMGIGLFEPVDDINAHTIYYQSEVLDYLERVMKEINYDTKKFLEILYYTKHFQIPGSYEEFEGRKYPLMERPLARMRAEQVWNSLLALTRKNINEYFAVDPAQPTDQYIDKLLIDGYTEANLMDIWAKVREIADNEIKAQEESQKKSKASNNKIQANMYDAPKPNKKPEVAANQMQSNQNMQSMQSMQMQDMKMKEAEPTKLKDKLQGLATDIVSPAPDQHFLNFFGQSQRLVIEEGNADPTLPQVLALMNSQLTTNFIMKNSYIKRQVNQIKENADKVEYLYHVTLTRAPNKNELYTAINYLQKNEKTGVEDLIWVLVNTREFIFVQ